MAQPPFLLDQLQIEPGSAGTRLIDRDPATGSLRFKDAVLTGGILLSQLAGLRTIGGVYVVGKSGAGAAYTTIQAALDAVPSSSSPTSPALVLVLPGVYTETVNIVRNGVILLALGEVVLRSALEDTPNAIGCDHTLIISAQLGTVPQQVLIEGFTITNSHDNKACVRVVGGAASQVGAGQILLRDCRLEAAAAGGNRPLWATAINTLVVDRGAWPDSGLSLGLIEECMLVTIRGIDSLPALQLDYDDSQPLPAGGYPPVYHIINCADIGRVSGLNPAVSGTVSSGVEQRVLLTNCTVPGTLNLTSNQVFRAFNSYISTLTLQSTVAATLANCGVWSITDNANATLACPVLSGTAVFANDTQVAVTFGIPMPDAEYTVSVEMDSQPNNAGVWWVGPKAATGFTLNFADAQTLNARWTATRTEV